MPFILPNRKIIHPYKTPIVVVGSAPTQDIDEDCTTTTNWTFIGTGYASDGSQIYNSDTTTFSNYKMIHGTATAADCYVLSQVWNIENNTIRQSPGILLRAGVNNSAATTHYQVVLVNNSSGVKVDSHDSSGNFASNEINDNVGANWADQNYIGASITGTGASTRFRLWRFTSDPGAPGIGGADWGAPDVDTTKTPTNAVDTGDYVGLRVYTSSSPSSSSSLRPEWNTFEAWS